MIRRAMESPRPVPPFLRVLELSTKCEPGEGIQVAMQARAVLEAAGIDLTSEQQTKTKTALEFFAAELKAQGE